MGTASRIKPFGPVSAACIVGALFIAPVSSAHAQDIHFRFDGDVSPGEFFPKQVDPDFAADRDGNEPGAIDVGTKGVVAEEVSIDPDDTRQLTITAWIKIDAGVTGQRFLVTAGAGSNWPALMVTNGRLEAVAGRGRPDRKPVWIETPMPYDEWVPVAGVWDFDARTVLLYHGAAPPELVPELVTGLQMSDNDILDQLHHRDGERDAEKVPYIFIGAGTITTPFRKPADGIAIDDVRIYREALSAETIASLGSDAPVAGSGATSTGVAQQDSAVPAGATVDSDSEATTDKADPAPAAGAAPALVPCSVQEDCGTGTYCALDDTCHPEMHLPKGSLQAGIVERDPTFGPLPTDTDAGTQPTPERAIATPDASTIADPTALASALNYTLSPEAVLSELSATDHYKGTLPDKGALPEYTHQVHLDKVTEGFSQISITTLEGGLHFCEMHLDYSTTDLRRQIAGGIGITGCGVEERGDIKPDLVTWIRICAMIGGGSTSVYVRGFSFGGRRFDRDGRLSLTGSDTFIYTKGPCEKQARVECPVDHVASGIVVHSWDWDKGDGTMQGFQLICRKFIPQLAVED